MNNVPSAQSSKKTDPEEYDLVILGGGTRINNRCLDLCQARTAFRSDRPQIPWWIVPEHCLSP